jgi:very-short-patch-repair endonuclease
MPVSKEELKERHLISVGCHLPYNPELKQRAKDLRHDPTSAERKIWEEVLCGNKFLGYRFLRQKPIDNFIVDFYCAELRLVIKIDGECHADKPEFDYYRTEILEKYGLRVVRFTNQRILYNLEEVTGELMNLIPPVPFDKGGHQSSHEKGLSRGDSC